MEFPDLGQHCHVGACQRLDFLPLRCARCGHSFCDEHSTYDAHSCPVVVDVRTSKRVPVCPLCSQIIQILPGEDADQKVNAHIEAGCPEVAALKTPKFNCSLPKCKHTELQRILCPYCKHQFCLRHKQPGDHQCDKQPHKAANTASAAPDNKQQWSVWNKLTGTATRLADILSAHQANRKQSALNNKVALMKAKQKAQGPSSVAPEKRFYLEVLYPQESRISPKWFFFDENKRYGFVLDEVAAAGKVRNNNNVPDAPKLQLFSLKTGEPLSTSKTLKEHQDDVASCDAVLLAFAKPAEAT